MRVNYIISFIEKVAIVIVAITLLGGTFSVMPAYAEEHRGHHHGHDDEHGHGHDRGWHRGEHHHHGHDRHWREEYEPEPYYPPVYAPEPVVVAPPPPSPGINIIFPIHIH